MPTLIDGRRATTSAIRGPLGGITILGLGAVYFTSTDSPFNLFVFNMCLLAAIGAIALNMLMGTAGLVSIGNAAFLATGAFTTVFFSRAGVPFPVDILLAGIVAGVIGLIVGLTSLRLAGLTLALSTLAAHFILLYIANRYQSGADGAGSAGFSLEPIFTSIPFEVSERYWVWLLWGVVSAVILMAWALTHGKTGRAWRLQREHAGVAASVGVPVRMYKLQAFAVSSFLIAVQGGLAAHYAGHVTIENYTLLVSIQVIAMILIGGLDSIVGAVVGGILITWLAYLVSDATALLMGDNAASLKGPQISVVVYGLLIILFITRSPDGIVGWMRAISRGAVFRWRPAGWATRSGGPALPTTQARRQAGPTSKT